MRVLRFTSRTATDGCKKMKKKERKNYKSIKADAATNINHNSVSKNIHTVSFTLHSHDEKLSNTWCVNVNILLHLVRPRCIFARCVNILTYMYLHSHAQNTYLSIFTRRANIHTCVNFAHVNCTLGVQKHQKNECKLH